MRFPFSLSWKAENGKFVGLKNDLPESPAGKRVFETRTKSIDGFPLQRIVVGIRGPKSGLRFTCSAFLFVEQTDATPVGWFDLGAAEVETGRLFYFDVPTLLDSPGTGQQGSAGTTQVFFAPRADPAEEVFDGDYVLVAGSDMSNPAF